MMQMILGFGGGEWLSCRVVVVGKGAGALTEKWVGWKSAEGGGMGLAFENNQINKGRKMGKRVTVL